MWKVFEYSTCGHMAAEIRIDHIYILLWNQIIVKSISYMIIYYKVFLCRLSMQKMSRLLVFKYCIIILQSMLLSLCNKRHERDSVYIHCLTLSLFTHNEHSLWYILLAWNISFKLKLTWTVTYHYRRQPYFFWQTFIWNRVLARCLSWFISFAWASSSCKERKRDLQNKKIFLLTAGLELTTFGFWSYRLNR